jgi:predicted nucleic acid-binding Zn ribbon protein
MTASRQSNDLHKPVEISRLLSTVFESKKWRSKLELHRVFEFWNKTVGKDIASVAQPSLVRGRVLWIKVADPIWMQQLHLQKILLLEKINKQLQSETFSDIHLQLNSSLSVPPEPESKKPKAVIIDKKKEQEFDRLISSLEGDELKASLKSLWIMIHTKG